MNAEFEYQHIRDEVHAEHTLLANRLTWYVTSQSFLVTAFTISSGTGFAWHPWFSTTLLPSVALASSLLVFPSIVAASTTIRLWHVKQKEFFERNAEFNATFHLNRAPWVEKRALLFPIVLPIIFGLFWIIVHVASYWR